MLRKTVLVTGANGYIGNGIVQRLLDKGHKVIGVDNKVKDRWLKEVNSISAIDVDHYKELSIKEIYNDYDFYEIDIFKNPSSLSELFKHYKFDTIINLAQNPSAPYSQIDLKNASWTIQNNTIGTLNLLWLIKEHCPESHLIEIESMGTFNPAVNTDIPEGKFQFEYNGRTSEPSIFPKQAGSFYHASKIFNTYLNECANRWWGIKSTIINQGVVYGNTTREIEKTGIHSHLSVDECFGTVINRFIVQALLKEDLTVYGNGDQKRCFLSLNDSVQCLELFLENPPENNEIRIVNQLDEVFTMNELAEKVIQVSKDELNYNIKKKHIESPRVENTDDFYYNPINDTLKSLGFKQTRTIEDEIRFAFKHVNPNILKKLRHTVIPKVTWK